MSTFPSTLTAYLSMGFNLPCLLDAWFIRRLSPRAVFAMPIFSVQVKSSCTFPNFIEQTAHCDHKPRAAWVHVRMFLRRRSAAGWAECMIYSALVSFSSPYILTFLKLRRSGWSASAAEWYLRGANPQKSRQGPVLLAVAQQANSRGATQGLM